MVQRLIAFAPEDEQAGLASELDGLVVVGSCECGCLTVEFGTEAGDRQVLDGAGDDTDGMVISFILHVIAGHLSQLEIIRGDGEPIRQPPAPAAIDRVTWRESDGVMQRHAGE